MGAPPKLPPDDVLRDLRVRQKKTYKEIADMYGATEKGVHWRLRQAGLVDGRTAKTKAAPWVVKNEHQHEEPMRMLRLLNKRAKGTLEGAPANRLDAWLQWLDEESLVVCYAPEKGFWYDSKRPSDGKSITR